MRLIPLHSLLLLAVSCTPKGPTESGPVDELFARGALVYKSNCIACHNPDPTKDGPLGPSVQCSSPELLESRILKAEYPPSYKPKRNSKVMTALPQLKADLQALTHYLRCTK